MGCDLHTIDFLMLLSGLRSVRSKELTEAVGLEEEEITQQVDRTDGPPTLHRKELTQIKALPPGYPKCTHTCGSL